MFIWTLISMLGPADAVEYAEILPIGTLVEAADQAVQGQVVQTSSEWGNDGLIYTRVVLDAEDRLYQTAEPTTSFLVPGGEIGDVRLTVPGVPTFAVGEDVLVFLMEDRLLGLGQGTFRLHDGILERAVDKKPLQAPVRHVLGDPDEARGCSQERMMVSLEDGWATRRHSMLRLGGRDAAALEVTLMEGLEYSVQICGDGLAEGLALAVFDEQDRNLAEIELEGAVDELRFRVPETGTYWIAATNEGLKDGWRSALSVSLRYR